MPFVDGHFHIWELERFKYFWPTEAEKEAGLFKDFTIEEYNRQRGETPVKYGVFIQVLNHSPEEAEWLFELAEKNPAIKGVVAGVDLTSPNLEGVLDRLSKNKLFVGVRHILDVEKVDWITTEAALRGLAALEKRGLTYDLLLRPYYLKYIPEVISKFPNLRFVVDHIAKPYVKDKKIDGWREEIAEIAKYPNVHCKISGLVNEGDLNNWKADDFKPYIEHILSIFGVDRCFFGSDWPVCTQADCEYKDVYNLATGLLSHLSDDDKEKLFSKNCINFYNLKVE